MVGSGGLPLPRCAVGAGMVVQVGNRRYGGVDPFLTPHQLPTRDAPLPCSSRGFLLIGFQKSKSGALAAWSPPFVCVTLGLGKHGSAGLCPM